jgi:hypothetical protein
MYARQFATVGLLTAMFVLFPTGQAMGQILGGSASGSITLPVAGTITASTTQAVGGLFSGSFTINSFARIDASNIVAVGMVRGTIANPAGQVVQSVLQTLALPVNLAPIVGANLESPLSITPKAPVVKASYSGERPKFIKAQFGSCSNSLRIQMGSAAAVNIMGNSVVLSPVGVDVAGNTGAVGGLVCQILGLLGGFLDVVPLLNSLLGSLTGLLGGSTGGLLGGIL